MWLALETIMRNRPILGNGPVSYQLPATIHNSETLFINANGRPAGNIVITQDEGLAAMYLARGPSKRTAEQDIIFVKTLKKLLGDENDYHR